ncbi:MAG: LbtU family siderophore porin [Desulfuromonadales bacterium]|nr:LbtU family siderophore porin [Desulfuromonadales bacterium]
MALHRKLVIFALSGLFAAAPALASHSATPIDPELHGPVLLLAHADTRAGIENLQERRAAVTEESVSPLIWKIGEASFTLHGLIEVEASRLHPEGGDDDDDLRLSTVQIGLDAEITPWLGGHVIGLWEEADTEPMVIDEAVLSLTSPWELVGQTPALHLGRQYLPFGRFDSAMISDPLTLELGETHTTAGLLALTGERWSATVGAFEGSVDDGDEGLDSWVAAVEATPLEGVTVGASWISDLAESDAQLVADEGFYREEVAGWSAFVTVQHGSLGLTAEYLVAAESFEAEQVEAGGDLTGERPEAWNLEFSWQVTEKLQLAGRYEEANSYQADLHRYGATVSRGLCDYALLAVEYLNARAEGEAPAHTVTAQLAVEF